MVRAMTPDPNAPPVLFSSATQAAITASANTEPKRQRRKALKPEAAVSADSITTENGNPSAYLSLTRSGAGR